LKQTAKAAATSLCLIATLI